MSSPTELLSGTWELPRPRLEDRRGVFVKTMTRGLFGELGLPFEYSEEFYSISNRDVIRGMHFQIPPHDHVKLVYCAVGEVLDVLVDLRSGPDYGRVASLTLSAADPKVLIIPKGIAHGFRSITDGSLMVYKTSTEHAPAHDRGLRWDSFGFDWGSADPIVSDRDLAHPGFPSFDSPF
jgi:dTDP-4-dehydrorhamnose 3,5-epimerase